LVPPFEEESMKEYHEPTVTEYGEVREITEGKPSDLT
jgi:hypothetical protein